MSSVLAQFTPQTLGPIPQVITYASVALAIVGAATLSRYVVRVPMTLGFVLIKRCYAYLAGERPAKAGSLVAKAKVAGNPNNPGPGGGGLGGAGTGGKGK